MNTILGAQTYEEAVPFIREKFRQSNKNIKRTLKIHEMCTTDTDQVKLVIYNSIETIIKENSKDAMRVFFNVSSCKINVLCKINVSVIESTFSLPIISQKNISRTDTKFCPLPLDLESKRLVCHDIIECD